MPDSADVKQLQDAIAREHGTPCRHIGSIDVRGMVGETVPSFSGIVSVFDLLGHPRAKQAYAWRYGGPTDVVVALAVAPTATALDAVRAWLATRTK